LSPDRCSFWLRYRLISHTLLLVVLYIYEPWSFFFSSRTRHTRWPRDWSSDVCSSDLRAAAVVHQDLLPEGRRPRLADEARGRVRSEERRVGKECRSRWIADL